MSDQQIQQISGKYADGLPILTNKVEAKILISKAINEALTLYKQELIKELPSDGEIKGNYPLNSETSERIGATWMRDKIKNKLTEK
jgi:hypothetical protein